MKTADHFWTDPSADELVQRHRIHSSHCRQDSPTKRPALCVSGGTRPAPGTPAAWEGLRSPLMREGRKVRSRDVFKPEAQGTRAVETAGPARRCVVASLPAENITCEQKAKAAEVCSVYCKESTRPGLL